MFLLIIWNSLYKHMEKKFRISGIWLPHNLLRIRKLFYSIMEENSIKENILYFLKFSLQTYGKKFRIFGIWSTRGPIRAQKLSGRQPIRVLIIQSAANQITDFLGGSQSERACPKSRFFLGGEGGETSVAVNS